MEKSDEGTKKCLRCKKIRILLDTQSEECFDDCPYKQQPKPKDDAQPK